MRCVVTLEKIVSGVWETVALRPDELDDSDTIAQAVNAKTSVTLRILPSFEAWQFCEKSITYVRVIDLDRDSDRIIFRGRVSEITDSMNDSGALYQDITCVSALDFFEDTSFFANDSTGYLVKPTDPADGLIPVGIVGNHNSAVGSDTFRRFSCEITGNAYYAKGGTVYGSRYSVLSAMMTGGDLRRYTGGGIAAGAYTMEFRESFSGDINTLQIAEKFGRTVDTAILIGDNLRNIRVEKALQDAVYTRIRAVSGVNSDGSREFAYATNDEMYTKYGGGRELLVVNDDIKCTAPMYERTAYGTTARTAANLAMLAALEEFAEQEAANLSDPPVKLTISADDLAEMGFKGYEPFEVGNSYPVICPPLGLNGKPMRITALRRRLCDGRVEQITVEAGKKVVKSSSSLSAMMSRLEELNRQVSDNAAEQVEIIDSKIGEQSGGLKTNPLTQDEFDAITTKDNNTIYYVDNNGNISIYKGNTHISTGGGGDEPTIETAVVLTSGQMTEWAPEHALVPVEFRGSAAVYYAQAPARLVIQGQLALFGMTDSQVTVNDIMSELMYEFRDGDRQKLKLFIRTMTETSIGVSAALYDVTGTAETLINAQSNSYTFYLPSGWRSLKVGFAVHVSEYYLNADEQIAPHYGIREYAFADGVKCTGTNGVISYPQPGLSGQKFDGAGVTQTDFGSDAERGFACGISRRTEPSYGDGDDEEEEASE